MKNKTIILLLMLFITGCAQDKVEVIPDYESIYYSDDKVDITAEPKNEEEWLKTIEKDLIQCAEKTFGKSKKEKISYSLKYRLFFDENGKVEKAKNLSEDIPENENKKLFECFISTANKWKISPAKLKGQNVKSWTDLKMPLIAEADGNFKIDLDLDLNLDFGSFFFNKEEFISAADEQPDPIGGIEALQRAIKYPEEAKKAGKEGRVMLKAFIDENGVVVKTEVLKRVGYGLDEAAEKAVQSVKFIPAKQRGQIVKAVVVIPIIFKLN